MKKSCILFISAILCFCLSVNNVSAETLDEYIAKAEAALNAKKAADDKKKMTEAEKEEALAEKEQVETDIQNIETEITNLKQEIQNLEESIDKKDAEIKEIIRFVQISNGESAYLEYAFGASTFTDFIYRVSVAEQLSNYNDELITSYNNDVKKLEQNQRDLSAEQQQLKEKETQLSSLVQKLSAQVEELTDASQTYEQEYQNFMNYVNTLRSMGCKGNEDMSTCQARVNPPAINTGGGSVTGGGNANGFYIPLTQGRVTQNWKGSSVHNAIDIANYEGAPVYAITTGRVRVVTSGCGEKVVYIVHNVNGRNYTTVYYHLKTVTVSTNQVVYYTTQIGTQGGNPNHGATCGCTGSHVDVKLFNGEYMVDFFTLTGDGARYNIDPRTWLTQLPPVGQRFYSR